MNIKRCLLCCNLSAVRWFSTSHPPWIASSGASSRLAFFRTVRPLTGIVSHYRESMLSMPEDRCAHYEWSGALITAIVRESWELNLHQSGREAAVSVWICVNTREHSVTKTPNEFLLRILHILTCILNLNKCLWWLGLSDITLLLMEAAVCRGIIAQVAVFTPVFPENNQILPAYKCLPSPAAIWQKSQFVIFYREPCIWTFLTPN